MTLSLLELYELNEEVSRRMGSTQILEMLSLANRQGTLDSLLTSIGMDDLTEEGDAYSSPKQVLVIGESQVSEGKLRAIIRKAEMDDNYFEFCLEYDRIKRYNFSKLRCSENYRAVLVGPQPHSTQGKLNSSSAITELENHPELYPPVIRLTSSNELKITAKSFKDALVELERMVA